MAEAVIGGLLTTIVTTALFVLPFCSIPKTKNCKFQGKSQREVTDPGSVYHLAGNAGLTILVTPGQRLNALDAGGSGLAESGDIYNGPPLLITSAIENGQESLTDEPGPPDLAWTMDGHDAAADVAQISWDHAPEYGLTFEGLDNSMSVAELQSLRYEPNGTMSGRLPDGQKIHGRWELDPGFRDWLATQGKAQT